MKKTIALTLGMISILSLSSCFAGGMERVFATSIKGKCPVDKEFSFSAKGGKFIAFNIDKDGANFIIKPQGYIKIVKKPDPLFGLYSSSVTISGYNSEEENYLFVEHVAFEDDYGIRFVYTDAPMYRHILIKNNLENDINIGHMAFWC